MSSFKYLLISLGLIGASATGIGRLAACDKAGITSATDLCPSYTNRAESPTESIPWHEAIAPVAFARAKAFERLRDRKLRAVNAEIKQWLLYAQYKKTKKLNIDHLDPSNPRNLTIFQRAKKQRVDEKYINGDMLGKCSGGIKPEICRIAQDQLRRFDIDPANVAISGIPTSPFHGNMSKAAAYSSILKPGKYLLYINDNYYDRLDTFWPSIGENYKCSDELQNTIAHEASHFLNKDSVHEWMVGTYVPRVRRPIRRLHEIRADLFSVFHSPMPLASALFLAKDKYDSIYYSHRNSANWQELISDLRSLGLNENSRQIDV